MSEFERLHPSLQYHLVNTLGWNALRPVQLEAIGPIHDGLHCLLLAPTAGGKTEAAAIPVLSRMLQEQWAATSTLYVCPLKALLNNLEPRLARYAGLVGRRAEVWHGDVSVSRKNRALRESPDILLTTPESLEAMLVSPRINRNIWFGHLRAVVVDELHAFAGDDRGWHLRAILERLSHYTGHPLQRIGLSATVGSPEDLLRWFAPDGVSSIVGETAVNTDAEVTLDHVASLENAATVIARLHAGEKRLVFCDSRSRTEQLSSLLRGKSVRTYVSHSSLSADERRLAEKAFAEEPDCVIVATSTLELGIDVGDLDRVIQIDAPGTVSSFLQRMGRTGRRAGSRRNCLFLATNDDAFLLALGVTKKWSEGWVEDTAPPPEPWPIVVQQALVSVLEYGEMAGHEVTALLSRCFPELAAIDITSLVRHLVALQFLIDQEGVIRIGPQAEEQFGGRHYGDLLASFSGSPLLTARYGSTEIGYIDPAVLAVRSEERIILLGGRSWRVTTVEWNRQTVWLEPVSDRGKALWLGESRELSRAICEAVRAVLTDGPPPSLRLSQRAKAALAELREKIAVKSGRHYFVEPDKTGSTRVWTFAGTRINRTWARQISDCDPGVRFDALSIQTERLDSLRARPEFPPLRDQELSSFHRAMKFSECLPDHLFKRTILARQFVKPDSADDVLAP